MQQGPHLRTERSGFLVIKDRCSWGRGGKLPGADPQVTQAGLGSGSLNYRLLICALPRHSKHKFFSFQSLVVKPDQLIKRRGKLGLVGVNLTLDGVKSWLKPRLGQEATVSVVHGRLHNSSSMVRPVAGHMAAREGCVLWS